MAWHTARLGASRRWKGEGGDGRVSAIARRSGVDPQRGNEEMIGALSEEWYARPVLFVADIDRTLEATDDTLRELMGSKQ